MSKTRKRRRGTAILERREGILVAKGKRRCFLLPGGGAARGESRTSAAKRELGEETHLRAYYSKYLFRHVGIVHRQHGHCYRDYHTVCLFKARGTPRPGQEIERVAFYRPGSGVHISYETGQIIEKYYRYKKRAKEKREANKLDK